MRQFGFVLSVCVFAAVTGWAETKVVEGAEMVVTAEPLHSARVVGQDASVAVSLAATPGVQVSSQGVPGGQADLSIRGSSFSGAGLSLNGLSLSSAQTEHFNAEIPIIAGVLSEPQVLTGFDQVTRTEGHLVGTADFTIMPVETGRSLTLGYAEEEGYWLNALLQERRSLSSDGDYVGVGAFGSYTEINAVDYPDNDVLSTRAGAQLQAVTGESQWDALVAYQEKQFGARGYYGVTPAWDAREETEDTLIIGSWLNGDLEGNYTRVSIMWREQMDDYTLFWTLPGVYNNDHRTVTYSGMVGGHRLLGRSTGLDWRVHGVTDRIESSSLGDHERSRGGVTLIPGVALGRWSFKAGARYETLPHDETEILPQGAVELSLIDGLSLRLAHSQSVREPSYTELNYESPASLGNAGLKNQTSETTELQAVGEAACGLTWLIGVFQRTEDDAVDWVRETDESTRWTAMNLGEIDTEGVEVSVAMKAADGSRIAAYYQYLSKVTNTEIYSSRYALDYPEHYFLLSGLWQISSRLGVELAQAVRQQDDNPLRTSSDMGYDGRLAVHLLLFREPRAQLTVMASNLWDDDYTYFPGQETIAPRRVSAGITVDW